MTYSVTNRGRVIAPLLDRLWAKIDVRDSVEECWPWLGTKIKGYGQIYCGRGQNKAVTTLLYELHVGPLPPKGVPDHLCNNHGCANPFHLEGVTMQENSLRIHHPERRLFRVVTDSTLDLLHRTEL